MTSGKDVDASYDERDVEVSAPKHQAAGVKAVMVSMQRGLAEMGDRKSVV